MKCHEEQFLFLLKSYFNNQKIPDGYDIDIGRVFFLSSVHNLMPIIYSKLSETTLDISEYKISVMKLCVNQIKKNIEFESLAVALKDEKINFIVVKGPICADCYPDPDIRLSSDFDIVVDEKHLEKLNDYLLSNGFIQKNCAYISESKGLYIEVSTELGEGNNKLKDSANTVFEGFFERSADFRGYRTLSETDHIIYLVFHAYKHFIGSGFGIRQLIDIYLFMLKYNDNIDYNIFFDSMRELGILNFAFNVFSSLEEIFDADFNFLLKNADPEKLCVECFLEDLLAAGVFGKSSEDRLHSATIIQEVVANGGKKSFVNTVFPQFSLMKNKYNILNKLPFLLPLFWIFRLVKYFVKLVSGKKSVSPVKSINIAENRIELMKKMGII